MPEHEQSKLREIAGVFLAPGDDFGPLKRAAREFHDLCADICGIRGDGDQRRDADMHLPSGNAISPRYAAHTVFDLLRTKRFIRGLFDGIHAARRRFAGTVHVLYAGCGPYATLALPLMQTWRPGEVGWTLLDVQPDSLQAARAIVERCGLADRVVDYFMADATTYRHEGRPPHVLVTETMQNLLFNEPQVAITLNLYPQLAPGGFLVPEEIRVDALLGRILPDNSSSADGWDRLIEQEEGARPASLLGTLLRLNADFAGIQTAGPNCESIPAIRFDLPPYDPGLQLRLETTIRVFGETALVPGNSSLCLPRVVSDWKEHPSARRIEFQYRLGRTPGFRIDFLSADA